MEQIAEKLEECKVNVTGGSHAATFVKSSKGNTADKGEKSSLILFARVHHAYLPIDAPSLFINLLSVTLVLL